jgi:translation initiation factor 1 (eIF-1/SUI1)
MRKYNILEIDKVELFKAEEELLKIDPTISVLSTIDNKSHEVRFITKINEFKHQLDPIADEIRSLFKSNSNLKKFSLPQRN